jgi:tRNA (guanine-N7-)-methyltransferase
MIGSIEHFYGRRKGKPLKKAHLQRLESILPGLSIPLPDLDFVDLSQVFNDPALRQYSLEIGFGGGEHLVTQAINNPQTGFIGAEAFINGVASLLHLVEEQALTNIRVFPQPVWPLLKKLRPRSLAKVFILFPDPWPKIRHHKRRLIQRETLRAIEQLLVADGELRIASDHREYIDWIVKLTTNIAGLVPQFDITSPPTHKPNDWPSTRYEEKALKLGKLCYYLTYGLSSRGE